MSFNKDQMLKPTQENEVELVSEAGIKYAQATNDPIELHLNGTYMPPIYAVVPVWEKVFEVVANVVPEEHFFSVVHGEQDMIFHQPLKAGLKVKNSAVGQSISVKESGTSLVVKTETKDANSGELIVEQYFNMFFRGVDGGEDIGFPHSSGLDVTQYNQAIEGTPIASRDAHIDDDQTFRYAEASGDKMPIHLDDDFAKSVGLPGIIVHGLCTMAHASWAAIENLCESDPTKLHRIALRFSKPLLPGEDIVTSFYSSESAEDDKTFMFKTVRKSDETPILTNAFVQLRA